MSFCCLGSGSDTSLRSLHRKIPPLVWGLLETPSVEIQADRKCMFYVYLTTTEASETSGRTVGTWENLSACALSLGQHLRTNLLRSLYTTRNLGMEFLIDLTITHPLQIYQTPQNLHNYDLWNVRFWNLTLKLSNSVKLKARNPL